MNREEALSIVRDCLKPGHFRHSVGVAETAEKLALLWGADPEKAFLAGILHDYAKDMEEDRLIAVAVDNGLLKEDWQRDIPEVLHGGVGAVLLEQEQKITDSAILSAIRNHTLGSPHMPILDEIVLVADMIEPYSRSAAEFGPIRALAEVDLQQAVLAALNATLSYCLKQKKLIHPQTVITRNYYVKLITTKES